MITVRPGTRNDTAAWLRMRLALWPDEMPEHAAEIERYFEGVAKEPLEVLLAVDDGGAALGFAELSIRNYAEDCITDHVAFLEGWYVEPHARRLGVGRALIAAAEQWALAQGCSEFASDALLDNDVSALAHRALGFEETTQLRCFRKTLETAKQPPSIPTASAAVASTITPPLDAEESRPAWSITRLHHLDETHVQGLVDVLLDCVDGGASVSFMHPLTRERATTFWRRVADDVAAGRRALLVAADADGICGTVQLVLDLPENQPHRADLAKMLVHRRARRSGLGAALLRAAESMALDCGRTLLVLDAVTGGDAERLYGRLGWVRVGPIPRYALFPQGGLCSTTVFYRDLSR